MPFSVLRSMLSKVVHSTEQGELARRAGTDVSQFQPVRSMPAASEPPTTPFLPGSPLKEKLSTLAEGALFEGPDLEGFSGLVSVRRKGVLESRARLTANRRRF